MKCLKKKEKLSLRLKGKTRNTKKRKEKSRKKKKKESLWYLDHLKRNSYWSNHSLIWHLLKIVNNWLSSISSLIMSKVSMYHHAQSKSSRITALIWCKWLHIQAGSWDVSKVLPFRIIKERLEKDPEIITKDLSRANLSHFFLLLYIISMILWATYYVKYLKAQYLKKSISSCIQACLLSRMSS